MLSWTEAGRGRGSVSRLVRDLIGYGSGCQTTLRLVQHCSVLHSPQRSLLQTNMQSECKESSIFKVFPPSVIQW